MREARLTVVISQGQSRSPDKRQLESDIAESAARLTDVDVLVVPHLYDLARDGETFSRLRDVPGPIAICAWLYDRATHWVLDRNGIRGQTGEVQLREESDDEDEEAASAEAEAAAANGEERVIVQQPRPDRRIYCIDLRVSQQASAFAEELARIAQFETDSASHAAELPTLLGNAGVTTIAEHPTRRWYPVIDFSRCTNCMECIDFCLFGVYGIDSVETILVEQPDNCRKGCPACSRVCPQNAIIFPQHKTPAIAGAPMDSGGLKIDLSKLFGAPEEGADAIEVAARERDEQLLLAGRQAVGVTEDLAARIAKTSDQPRDDLDNLLDQLDSLEL
jgi:NAD-dependent dihydropyrimidine dehydrogenase PreA subunit